MCASPSSGSASYSVSSGSWVWIHCVTSRSPSGPTVGDRPRGTRLRLPLSGAWTRRVCGHRASDRPGAPVDGGCRASVPPTGQPRRPARAARGGVEARGAPAVGRTTGVGAGAGAATRRWVRRRGSASGSRGRVRVDGVGCGTGRVRGSSSRRGRRRERACVRRGLGWGCRSSPQPVGSCPAPGAASAGGWPASRVWYCFFGLMTSPVVRGVAPSPRPGSGSRPAPRRRAAHTSPG